MRGYEVRLTDSYDDRYVSLLSGGRSRYALPATKMYPRRGIRFQVNVS